MREGAGGVIVGDVARERSLGVRGCWWRGSREGGGGADVAHGTGAAASNDGDMARRRAVDAR